MDYITSEPTPADPSSKPQYPTFPQESRPKAGHSRAIPSSTTNTTTSPRARSDPTVARQRAAPSISVYWQNRLATGGRDQFDVISKTIASTASLSEYIIRVGDLLRKGPCKVDAMNVTRFDIYVVVQSEFGQD